MNGASNLEHRKEVLSNEEFKEFWTGIIYTEVKKKAIVKLQMKKPYYVKIKNQSGIKTKVLL